jgi:hypothetical protein
MGASEGLEEGGGLENSLDRVGGAEESWDHLEYQGNLWIRRIWPDTFDISPKSPNPEKGT